MPEVQRFIEVFDVASRQVGYLARHLQGEISLKSKKKESTPEAEALTAVDLAAQNIILLLLHDHFPEAAVDAEEKTDTVALFAPLSMDRPLIVVDPIDGTLNYARGSREYAVMAAWLERDWYRAALVHFPASRQTYWARQDAGCWKKDGNAGELVRIGALPQRVRVTPRVPEKYREALRHNGFEVVISRCSAVDATAPATGKAAGALSLGRPSRRRAVGFLLTVEAGGVVRIGDRWWKGEDPRSLPDERQFTVVADTCDTAERILRAVTPG